MNFQFLWTSRKRSRYLWIPYASCLTYFSYGVISTETADEAFKDLYVSQVPKKPFVIPPALARGLCFHEGLWGLLLPSPTTPLALQHGIYSFLLTLSWSISKENFFWFKLKTEEKGAMFVGACCFYRSDALVCKSCLSLLFKPSVYCTKASQACFLNSFAATVF
jgi:hypothetical protein